MLLRVFILILFFTISLECNEIIEKIKINVNGSFTGCTVYQYDYFNGLLDSNSKRKLRSYKFDEKGNEIEYKEFRRDSLYKRDVSKYDSSGHLIEEQNYYSDYFQYSYSDENGKYVDGSHYFSDSMLFIHTYKFNDKGKMIEMAIIGDDTTIVIFYYNENDSLSSITQYNNSSFRSKSLKKYNTNRKVIEIINLDKNDSEISKIIFKYDKKGNLIEKFNNGCGFQKITYKYDKLGYLIEEEQYSGHFNTRIKYNNCKKIIEDENYNEEGEIFNKQIYNYDNKGNLISKDLYNRYSNSIFRTKIYKYDDFGNLTEEVEYEIKKPISKLEYIYSK